MQCRAPDEVEVELAALARGRARLLVPYRPRSPAATIDPVAPTMLLDPTQSVSCDVELGPAEAQVVFGLAAISSDGDVEDIELTALVDALATFGILPDLDEDARENFVLQVIGRCDVEGLDTLLAAAIRALPHDDARLLALELTVEILVSDGQIPDAEVAYLHRIKDALGISDEDFIRVTHADDD